MNEVSMILKETRKIKIGRVFSFHKAKLISFKKLTLGASLVVQWLGIHLAMLGIQVQSLAGELRIPHATQQLNPRAATTEPTHHN